MKENKILSQFRAARHWLAARSDTFIHSALFLGAAVNTLMGTPVDPSYFALGLCMTESIRSVGVMTCYERALQNRSANLDQYNRYFVVSGSMSVGSMGIMLLYFQQPMGILPLSIPLLASIAVGGPKEFASIYQKLLNRRGDYSIPNPTDHLKPPIP